MGLAKSRKTSKGNPGVDHWSVHHFYDGEKWVEDYGDDNLEPSPIDQEEEEQD